MLIYSTLTRSSHVPFLTICLTATYVQYLEFGATKINSHASVISNNIIRCTYVVNVIFCR